MEQYQLVYQVHAVERMAQRGISEEEVEHILQTGDAIEVYTDDTPYPSDLFLGWSGTRPLHIVVATDITNRRKMIITAYEPDPNQWETDFKRRKP
jgi:hypothetical protein